MSKGQVSVFSVSGNSKKNSSTPPKIIENCIIDIWEPGPQTFWLVNCSVTLVQSLSPVQLLQSHGLRHTRLPCPSPTPGACSNSCPLSRWCRPTISASVDPFSSCLQSFPASGSFPRSQFFTSGGRNIGNIETPKYWSFSIGPSNEYSGLISFRDDWFYLLATQGTVKSLLQHHSSKASLLQHSAFFIV